MRNSFLFNTVAGALALCPYVAQAQDMDRQAAAETPDSEIVVTAQRRAQNLQDVPISVAVTSGADLQKANITNLETLSAQLPSVRVTQAPASDQIHIRGTGSGFNPGFEQSVATFVDGVYRGRARSSRAALFDVERVEVLKGPQTTYFGNNAIAGAFNITTRKPEFDFRYNGTLLYSPSDGEYMVEGGISAPLSEQLAVRVAGRFSGMDGYIKNTFTGHNGPHLRDFIGRVALLWQPSDGFESNLRVDIGRNRDKATANLELAHCPAATEFGAPRGLCARYLTAAGTAADTNLNFSSTAGDSLFNYDFTEVALTNTLDIGSSNLSLISSYFDHDMKIASVVVPTPFTGVFGAPVGAVVAQTESYKQFTQEIRFSSPTGGKIEYMVGAYFLYGDLDMFWGTGYWFAPFSNLPAVAAAGFPADSPLAFPTWNTQKQTSWSAFAAVTWNLSDDLRLVLGSRYSHVRKKAVRDSQIGVARDYFFADFVPVSPAAQAAAGNVVGLSTAPFPFKSRTDEKFMPSAVLQYDLADDVMAYASYTKGFKAGGFGFSSPDTFDPENVDAYEVGMKAMLFDRRLRFNLAVFQADYKNLQEATQILVVNDPNDPGDDAFKSVVGNSAKSRSRGVEISAVLKVSDGFSLHSDIAYLDSKYLDYPGAPCTQIEVVTIPNCSVNAGGVRRTFAPEWSGSAGVSITVPVANLVLKIDPSMYFSSRFFTQVANGDRLFSQPSYAKFDLRAGIGDPDGMWELAVIGKNLTRKDTAAFRQVVPTANGSVQLLPDRDRSVAIQFTLRN